MYKNNESEIRFYYLKLGRYAIYLYRHSKK